MFVIQFFKFVSIISSGDSLHCIFQSVLKHRVDNIYPRRAPSSSVSDPSTTIPLWLDLNEPELNFDPDKGNKAYLHCYFPLKYSHF